MLAVPAAARNSAADKAEHHECVAQSMLAPCERAREALCQAAERRRAQGMQPLRMETAEAAF
jgi:hypothetical protein